MKYFVAKTLKQIQTPDGPAFFVMKLTQQTLNALANCIAARNCMMAHSDRVSPAPSYFTFSFNRITCFWPRWIIYRGAQFYPSGGRIIPGHDYKYCWEYEDAEINCPQEALLENSPQTLFQLKTYSNKARFCATETITGSAIYCSTRWCTINSLENLIAQSLKISADQNNWNCPTLLADNFSEEEVIA